MSKGTQGAANFAKRCSVQSVAVVCLGGSTVPVSCGLLEGIGRLHCGRGVEQRAWLLGGALQTALLRVLRAGRALLNAQQFAVIAVILVCCELDYVHFVLVLGLE